MRLQQKRRFCNGDWGPQRAPARSAAPVTIAFIIGGGALTPHYIFIASIETLVLLYIIYLAAHWPDGH